MSKVISYTPHKHITSFNILEVMQHYGFMLQSLETVHCQISVDIGLTALMSGDRMGYRMSNVVTPALEMLSNKEKLVSGHINNSPLSINV